MFSVLRSLCFIQYHPLLSSTKQGMKHPLLQIWCLPFLELNLYLVW
nr:MAG TPA: hypothetical protein [Bacteriophage sp.]